MSLLSGMFSGGLVIQGTHPDVGRIHTGDVARAAHYGGQPYLYHWAPLSALSRLRREGLRPGVRRNFPHTSLSNEEYAKNVWFSAQKDRWMESVKWEVGEAVLLRVPTDAVDCRYDGAEWLTDTASTRFYALFEGRLSDCVVRGCVPPNLLQYRTKSGKWRRLAT